MFGAILLILREKVLTLVVVADEETALILQTQLRFETICINLTDNLLLQFLKINLTSVTLQIINVMVRKIENRVELAEFM